MLTSKQDQPFLWKPCPIHTPSQPKTSKHFFSIILSSLGSLVSYSGYLRFPQISMIHKLSVWFNSRLEMCLTVKLWDISGFPHINKIRHNSQGVKSWRVRHLWHLDLFQKSPFARWKPLPVSGKAVTNGLDVGLRDLEWRRNNLCDGFLITIYCDVSI